MIEDHHLDYSRPVTAFVTFTTQEAADRCERYFALNGSSYKEENAFRILGQKVDCYRAQEPSDILWENLAISRNEQRCRALIAAIGLGLFLILASFAVTILRQQIAHSAPIPSIDSHCPNVESLFGSDEKSFKEHALA